METHIEIPVLTKNRVVTKKQSKTAAPPCCTPKDNASVCCTPGEAPEDNGGACCAQPADGSTCCDK